MFGFEWNEKEEREALLKAGEARGEARGKVQGRLEGKLTTLKELVNKGSLPLATAAEAAGMSVDAFQKAVMI